MAIVDPLHVHATNDNNLSVACKRPVSSREGPVAFMTRVDVETILRKEKEKGFTSTIGLDLKIPYPVEITEKHYQVG